LAVADVAGASTYSQVIRRFLRSEIGADEFSTRFADMYAQRTDLDLPRGQLEALFDLYSAVDAFVPDPTLRDPEDLDEGQLRVEAAAVLERLLATGAASNISADPGQVSWRPALGAVVARRTRASWRAVPLVTAFVVVWLIQAAIVPHWLVKSSPGLAVLLQVIPAVLISVFVLIVGSLFAIAQQASTAHGSRASLIVANQRGVVALVLTPLALGMTSVFAAALIPSRGDPDDLLASAATTIVLGTSLLLVLAARRLGILFVRMTAPTNFAKAVLEDVDTYLNAGLPGAVVFRVGLLGEMLKASMRRGDAAGFYSALGALNRFTELYARAIVDAPESRTHTYENAVVEGWYGEEARTVLVSTGSDALALGSAEEDATAIADALRRLAEAGISTAGPREFTSGVDGLAQLGTSIHQVAASGAINLYAPAGHMLAALEARAEFRGELDHAAEALAAWLLVVAYWQTQFGLPSEMVFQRGLHTLGPRAPFHEAAAMILTPEFVSRWENKLPRGPLAVIGTMQAAIEEHASFNGIAPEPSPRQAPRVLPELAYWRRWLTAGLDDE
jgi:hypothetical protein